MKKIPTVFEREFVGHRIVTVKEIVAPELQDAFKNGIATVKVDGSCCALIEGVFYKRFDAKSGRKIPEGAIPCCEPDPVTGHHPHWVPVDFESKGDRWFVNALQHYQMMDSANYATMYMASAEHPVTFEAIGMHFNGNPYGLDYDTLERHGLRLTEVERSLRGVCEYLRVTPIEGLVFWINGEPVCKIKRSDFGFEWPCKGAM